MRPFSERRLIAEQGPSLAYKCTLPGFGKFDKSSSGPRLQNRTQRRSFPIVFFLALKSAYSQGCCTSPSTGESRSFCKPFLNLLAYKQHHALCASGGYRTSSMPWGSACWQDGSSCPADLSHPMGSSGAGAQNSASGVLEEVVSWSERKHMAGRGCSQTPACWVNFETCHKVCRCAQSPHSVATEVKK